MVSPPLDPLGHQHPGPYPSRGAAFPFGGGYGWGRQGYRSPEAGEKSRPETPQATSTPIPIPPAEA